MKKSSQVRTVLLVDDEQAVIDTYREVLSPEQEIDHNLDALSGLLGMEEQESPRLGEREAFRLIEARQGEEAVKLHGEALKKGDHPAVALVDMRMPPGMDGLKTAVRLRRQDPMIYIIIITAYSDVENEEIELALQHDFIFLKKPIKAEDLYQIVLNAANAYLSNATGTVRQQLPEQLRFDHVKQHVVLLVDDEPMMLKLATMILKQGLNLHILTASSGHEAIQLAIEHAPDLILLDVMMPEMDGFATCEVLKATETTKDIPIIFLTVQGSEEKTIRGFQVGAVDYVSKPFSQPILVARVSTHLNLYQKSRRLQRLSNTDALTELPNRAAFDTFLTERLEKAIESYGQSDGEYCVDERLRFALLFIDLDHFKPVNDEWGHEVGDQLLQAVAERLRGHVRDVDMLARIGGDEFVLILSGGASREEVGMVAEKLINLLCQPFRLRRTKVRIGASIGSALFPEDAKNGEELLHHADLAMYEAKAQGRSNHVAYTDDFKTEANLRTHKLKELATALEERQLELLLQPMLSVEHGEVVAFEALLHWNHPQHGVVNASSFIELLMEGELGAEAERYVFMEVFRLLQRLQAECNNTLPIIINILERHYEQGELHQYISDIADEAGVPHTLLKQIQLDVSGRLLMRQPEQALQQLNQLAALGVMVNLQDFGFDNYAMNWLQQLPLHWIKLDRKLVQQVGEQRSGEQLIQVLLTVIHQFGFKAVAEGVESREQLQFLQQSGCEAASGFYLYTPLSEEDVVAMLQ